jgi:hypothetical protein
MEGGLKMNITLEQLHSISEAVKMAGFYIEENQGASYFEKNDLIDFQNALIALNELEALK